MRILISGANGQLGRALQLALSGHSLILLDHKTLDVSGEHAAAAVIALFPELVIHAAAMTDVDACERNPEQAHRVNAIGTRHVAQACAELGAPIVYISTDYVFDGAKGDPYLEDDTPNPLSVYGRTKAEGEDAVRALAPKHYIVRTSWLYGQGPVNFVTKILSLAVERPRLSVVDTEVGSPTYTLDLAHAMALLVRHACYSTFHLANDGAASRYDFARAILDESGRSDYPLDRATEYRRAARPPAYAPLRNTRAAALGITLRPWREALRAFLQTVSTAPRA